MFIKNKSAKINFPALQDELLWGASWLLRATNDKTYLNYLNSLGANDQADIFSWDNKFAGARVLLARVINLIKQEISQESN